MQQRSTSAVVAGDALATLAASSRNTTKKGIVGKMRQHSTFEEMQQHGTLAVVAGGALAASSRNTKRELLDGYVSKTGCLKRVTRQ